MFNNVHTEFILTPLEDILIDGFNACEGVADRIDSFPMKEYFMQSLFLKMTGAQEQKLKCICWEMATNNYQYRYEYLNMKKYGECSSYKDKNDIFHDILTNIREVCRDFEVDMIWDDFKIQEEIILNERTKWETEVRNKYSKQAEAIISKQIEQGKHITDETKAKIRSKFNRKPLPEGDFQIHVNSLKKKQFFADVLNQYKVLLTKSRITTWDGVAYADYNSTLWRNLAIREINPGDALLGGKMQQLYHDIVFVHRNRCAHNTISYQQNLPTFDVMNKPEYLLENYFLRFIILIIIDEILMAAYRFYLKSLS